ncbi:flagellar biosynthesis protein FlgH [Rhodoferax koreense]|uniref:Flagellar L-ring protein n=1 Tax=Rhodoferax koreensis TaxID=1842727 RepID=A0A1P8JSA9_9BURK|nr:flagellar basal body L-ring protein FlgH [Rhodoferax koreense]APW36615.1 flagellar biosynthesis protein FlgH [Rhodoferax koreense]
MTALASVYCRLCSATLLASALLLTGCETLQKAPQVDFAESTLPRALPIAPSQAASTPPSGSLFASAKYRPAFEDRRPRLVGDSLTIQIVENVSASQKSTSTIDRTAANEANITAFPFLSAAQVGKVGLGASSSNAFSGKGGTESANTFSGAITTTVVEVLPNGHLVVAGEKQIGVNQNVDVLRFTGTVDPRAIQANSVVSSTQVANVRVESKGRGAQNEAQTIGWLSRFFLTLLPF